MHTMLQDALGFQNMVGALKGALDGGLDIPHSDKRFAGFKKEDKRLDAEVHRKYVYGGHVAAYMRTLIEDEPEKYQTHFSEYIKKGIEANGIEELYRKGHMLIALTVIDYFMLAAILVEVLQAAPWASQSVLLLLACPMPNQHNQRKPIHGP
ncbi:hypothetical protein IFM89_035610 [Coptis chinensis]|uniref:60S ribosomal protein L5 n=1 Tax=Coptis chinensis TaxID=261450 RepID=A0A835H4G8_9MAGN|nr:hypothetical protein IFM89_035610 [Coptis chinensis]